MLFSFGYTRGEPTIGAFGYRVMPWGFAAFLVLAGAVLVERRFRILGSGNGLAVPLLIVVVAGLVCATSLYRAWRATQDAEGPKPPG